MGQRDTTSQCGSGEITSASRLKMGRHGSARINKDGRHVCTRILSSPAMQHHFQAIYKSPTGSGVPCLVAQMGWWSHLNATWVLAGAEEVVAAGLGTTTSQHGDEYIAQTWRLGCAFAGRRRWRTSPTGLGPGALGAPRAINQASKQRFGSLAAMTSIFISINVAQQGG